MATASLALLKKGKTPAPPPPAADDTVTVDVDALDAAGVTALVTEHEIATPDGWAKMPLSKKKAWLKENFEDDGEKDETHMAEPDPAAVQEEPEAPVKTKTKAKGKAVAAPALVGEVLGPDELSDIVHDIENLKEPDARAAVSRLAEASEFTYFKLGGVLSLIQSNKWFKPYASFKEYVEQEHGIAYRRAMYWVNIYNRLIESGVSWDKVKSLGWSKMKNLAPILTKDNVDEWVKIAKNQTTLQLEETVKNASKQQVGATGAIEDQGSKTVTTKTFKLHEDQRQTIEDAIAKAKETAGTESDTVALEMICLDYMGGTSASMAERLKIVGLTQALELFAEAYPDTPLTINLDEEAEAA